MARKTKVLPRDWNGKPMFDIYEVDEDGEKIDGEKTRAIHSFGIKKAKVMLKHRKELETFVEENKDD